MEDVKNEAVSGRKGIPGSTLKLIAIITMFIDHVGASLFEFYTYKFMDQNGAEYCRQQMMAKVPWLWHDWMLDASTVNSIDMTLRSIGRIAFPIFCFLLVEGFIHTHDLRKYMIRLIIFAFVSDVPFDLAFFGEVTLRHQNVFFTLFFGVLALASIKKLSELDISHRMFKVPAKIGWLISGVLAGWGACTSMVSIFGIIFGSIFGADDTIQTVITGVIGFATGVIIYLCVSNKWDDEKKKRVSASLLTTLVFFGAAEVLFTDYGGWGVLAVVAIYVFRSNKDKGFAMGCLALTIMSFGEGIAFIDEIPIRMYNGKRGLRMKYFFYAFYPVHLFLLFLCRYYVFGM